METKVYWVGDRPGGAWIFEIRDARTGAPYNLSSYEGARAIMVDSDNNVVTFPEDNTAITDRTNGIVTFLWPTESVFTETGRYAIQLEIYGPSTTRKTTVQDILVREIGGITK